MKLLLPFFLATKLWGQAFTPQDLPWLAQGAQAVPLCLPGSILDTTPNLYLKLLTDCSGSLTNTTDASNVTNWFDLTSYHNDMVWPPNGTLGFNINIPRYRSSSFLTPLGQPTIDFANFASATGLLCNNSLSNQPNTVFVVAQLAKTTTGIANNVSTFNDSFAGGRSLFQTSPVSIGGAAYFYSGTTLVATPPLGETNWMVWTIQYNGASSLARTNGVNFITGNPGAAGLGRMLMGSDVTGNSDFFGRMAAFLVYNRALSPTEMTTIETTLRIHFGVP